MKKLMVVRVAVMDGQDQWFDNPILECLRYAGVVSVHASRTPSGRQVFDIFPPKHAWSESVQWSEMNAARMRSFGINAVACPSTQEVELCNSN